MPHAQYKIQKGGVQMAQSTQCLLLLAVIAVFFITEIIPLAVTATEGSIACGLLGFILSLIHI